MVKYRRRRSHPAAQQFPACVCSVVLQVYSGNSNITFTREAVGAAHARVSPQFTSQKTEVGGGRGDDYCLCLKITPNDSDAGYNLRNDDQEQFRRSSRETYTRARQVQPAGLSKRLDDLDSNQSTTVSGSFDLGNIMYFPAH